MILTQALIETLTREWASGISSAEIGRRMGISKNAVVGKAHRLRLPARQSPIKARDPNKIRPRAAFARPSAGRGLFSRVTRPATTSRPSAGEPRAAATTAHGVSSSTNLPEVVTPPRVFSHLPCRWIEGDRRTCDAPVRENARGRASGYCPEHFAIVYEPPRKKQSEPREPRMEWARNRGALWLKA